MDALTRRQFDRAMFAKDRTLAIRVGDYASRDIKEASFEYGYIKGDTYKPGGTCAGSGKITFTSIITTFNKLDSLHPEIGLLVGNTYQWVKMGEYFINDIEIDRNRNTTTLELMDGMFKLNREYVTDLHFPAEVREVIQEICLKTGIELANDYFGISAMRYHVEQVPEGKKLSFRDMLSAMTQMIGMSCFFNREGKMEIRDLTESNITINADSYFLNGLTKSEIEYQIAGITCKTDKKSLTVGMKTGRSLELDNVFMTQSALNDLYYKLKNLTYYPYNLNYQGHLLLEVGQWVTIQTNKKETFKVPVLSQSFTFKGGLRGRISADSKAGNDTQYSYEGTITKKIKQQDGIEAKIQAQIEAADAAFEGEFEKRKKAIDDGIELAKAKAEEVKKELSDNIDQRFNSFNNGPLQEVKRRAEEALRNAGASSSLAQEAKQIGLDSIARLEEFKRQATSAQTALSGDLDALKRTVMNDIRPKQEQVTAEIAKQVEALVQTKKELAGVKSAQATYEETTTRRFAELTNLANGKASKSELTQTAEELASKIASVQVGGRNLYVLSKNKDISRSSHLTDLKFDISSGEISFRATGLDPYFGEATIHPKSVSDRNGVRIPVILGKAIYVTVSNPIFIKNYISYFDKNGNTVRSYKYYKSSSFVISSKELEGANFITIRFGCGGSDFEVGSVIKTKIKVEYGTIPTDWSPAPEDIEGQISIVESNFRQRADALDAGVRSLTEGLRTKADISSLNVTAENIRQSVKSLETSTQNKLDQKLSMTEFEVRAGSIHQEILNATKDKADKTLVMTEAGKLREEFSNLRVGGTNLLKGSKGPFLPDRKPANFDNAILYAGNTSIYMEQGQEYIISAKTDGTFTAHHDGNKESDNVVLWIMDKDVRNYQIVSDLKTGTTGTKITWNKPTGIYHLRVNTYHKEATKSVWDVKIEKGNVATDWSPAPEDTDGLITEAKAIFERTAQGLRTDLSAIQDYVNKDGQRQETLQRYAREESAKQATAVRELVNRDFVGKSTYQEDVRGLERRFEAITNPKNGSIATQIANYKTAVDGRFADISSLLSGKANQSDFQRVKETSQLYERILGNTENGIADKVARMAMTNQLFQVEVSKNENLKTVQTQLAGSWAVQNINSAGDIISGINLGANGHNRITGKLTHITGETLIDKAVIKSAMIDKLKTANFEAGSVTTTILDAEAVTAEKLKVDFALVRKLTANDAFIEQLTSKRIFSTKVESVVSSSTFLEAYQGRIGGFTIGHFDQGRGRWISGINQFSVGMGNGEGGSYNGENTAFWANWGYSWNYPGPNAWYVTTSGNMYCRNGADFHGKVDFSDRSRVNFYSQPSFSKGAVINGNLQVSGRITYSGGEWLYSPIYNKLRKDTSQGGTWLYLDRQDNSGSDWIQMNKEISDRRYKSNIQDSQVSGLNVIEKLKTYSYRKEYDGKVEDISCGIMAQDVQKYAPEAFFENPDGAYSYRTFELVPYLIKAIQELNQKIEKMEKTIA